MKNENFVKLLMDDHRTLDELLRQLLEGSCCGIRAEPQTATQIFGNIRRGLTDHIRFEEQSVFPKFLEKSGMPKDQGPVAAMASEHRTFELLLEKASNCLDPIDPHGFLDTVRDLKERLQAHNQKEEGILYPMIADTLECDDQERISQEARNHFSKIN